MVACKNHIKKTALLIVFMIAGKSFLSVRAQENQAYHFTRFTTSNGLASSDISTLYQDSGNFLWIGHAAGVSRYDGYEYENFLFAGNHMLGKVNAITEDNEQTIWIGADGGLFYYRESKLFYADISHAPFITYSLATDKNNILWIGTDKGPVILRPASLQQTPVQEQKPASLAILSAWSASSVINKKAKFISLAVDGAAYISDGYMLYSYYDDKLTLVHTVTGSRDYITGIAALNKDTAYVSSQITGFCMVGKKDRLRYDFSYGIGNALTSAAGKMLYFASEGIYSFNPSTNTASRVMELPKQYQEWGSCVWRDKENNLWIGTHEELLYARPEIFSTIDHPFTGNLNELYSLYADKDGSLLLGGNRGRLFRKESGNNNNSFTLWKTVFPLAEVFDIHKQSNGDTWFCSGYEGLSLLRNGKLKRYTKAEGLRSNGNYKFLESVNKELFTCGENGVTKIIINGDSISFKNYFTAGSNTYNTYLTGGIVCADGSLLLGSDRGLLEWKNDSLYHIFINNADRKNQSITAIIRDRSDNIWISTVGDGILLCTEEENNLVLKKQFKTHDGLTSMIYLQLIEDSKGIIWAAGYKDITRLEKENDGTYLVTSYGQSHGFTANSFHSVKMAEDKNGIIWMATSSGLMYFKPEQTNMLLPAPVCTITAVSLYSIDTTTVDNTALADPGNLKLPYKRSSLSFHFTGIHLSNPTAVQYAYRLLGADSNWIMIDRERTVNFQNLPPGSYTFEVRASLGNAIWSNSESYPFMVQQPFWQRWWFLVLFALILAATGRFLIKLREKNIRKREVEKTEFEQIKTASYKHQLEIQQIINFFAASMNEQKNTDELLWDVTKNCISKLGLEDCVIYVKDETRNVLIQKAAWGPKTTEGNKITNPIEIALGRGIVGNVALTGKAEIIADTSSDERYIVDDVRRGSEITVPILNDKKVFGVIDSEHPKKDFYTERHLQVLTTIASLIADKIDKIKAEQQTRQKEMEVLKLNKNLAISQLTALRAQMNPHFIFNALNSVQQYILQGNVIEANKYLSRFSKLQREILNHCDQNFILLEKEIEMLDLYLQLEQLRFRDSFAYSIQLDDIVDPGEIKIPPMMLQPFVENAIWHGLMPKQDTRKVDIGFRFVEDDILLCTIQDNGIGREAASRLQQPAGNGKQHKSKGLSLVHERLTILRQQYQQPFEVTITDLTDDRGNPQGTLVSLLIFAGH